MSAASSGQELASRDNAVAAILGFGTLVLAWHYTLPAPYFLDSFGYVAWIEAWNETGEIPSRYRYANTLLYYVPVTLLGEIGLKVVGVLFTGALAAIYYLMIRRDFSAATGVGATLLLLSAPPTTISATHLKEDLTSLALFTLAILWMRPNAGVLRCAGVGVAYGTALLLKEIMLGAAPFLVGYAHLRCEQIERPSQLLRVGSLARTALRTAAIGLAAVTTIQLVSPTRINDFTTMAASPYMGQFYGLFSPHQATGLSYWAEALLLLQPWYLLPVAFFLATANERPLCQTLYLLMAVVLLAFLANVSVTRMRHFAPVLYFLAPVLFEGSRALIDVPADLITGRRARRRSVTALALIACASVCVAHLAYVRPTLELRLRYNSAREFYAPLQRRLPPDALLLGMDHCPIATYESGLECENHKPDLGPAAAQRYADAVQRRAAERPTYALPDFFDYDRHGAIRRAFEPRLEPEPVYENWWEPYHLMTYGRSVDHVVAASQHRFPVCVPTSRKQKPISVAEDLQLDEILLRYRCPEGEREIPLLTYDGHHTDLVRRSVLRVAPP